MEKTMSKITQETLIPLGVALLVIGTGAGWVTKTEMAIAQVHEESQEYKSKFKEICEILRGIDRRLGKMEDALSRLRK